MQGTTHTIRRRLETKGEEEGEVLGDPKTYVSVAIEQGLGHLSHYYYSTQLKHIQMSLCHESSADRHCIYTLNRGVYKH